MSITVTPLVRNMTFTESARWHDDAFWFSDLYSQSVYRLDQNDQPVQVVEVPNRPSGLGWTPDNQLLVVSMLSKELLRFDGQSLHQVADLSTYAGADCNDMVVAENGDAYIGNFGFDFTLDDFTPQAAVLVRADLQGNVEAVAEDMWFPNGSVILDEGKTLIVAESFQEKLTAFDINDDGSLSNRRIWAEMDGLFPDGISADTEGGIWVATPMTHQVVRVEEGGKITHKIPLEDRNAYSCAIGGSQSEYLYICTSVDTDVEMCRTNRSAGIDRVNLEELL